MLSVAGDQAVVCKHTQNICCTARDGHGNFADNICGIRHGNEDETEPEAEQEAEQNQKMSAFTRDDGQANPWETRLLGQEPNTSHGQLGGLLDKQLLGEGLYLVLEIDYGEHVDILASFGLIDHIWLQ